MPKYPIARLIADFDETISVQDTIGLIVHTAAVNRRSEGDLFIKAWEEMVEWYLTRYNDIRNRWLGGEAPIPGGAGIEENGLYGSSAAGPHAALSDFLRTFETLERASIQRVIEGGFLAGVTREQLRAAGAGVVKRPGVDHVLRELRFAGVEIQVLSANWSRALIEGAVENLCDQVTANCLAYDENGYSTGRLHLHVTSARDKLVHFQRRRTRVGKTLYIGDSISDFLALLDADFGVLIGRNRTAMRAINRFHVPTLSLQAGIGYKPGHSYQGALLLADSWKALEEFLAPRVNQ